MYQEYVTTCLRLIPQQKMLTRSLSEILDMTKTVDRRSGEEIVSDVMSRAGLTFGD